MLTVWGPRLSSEQHPRKASTGWIAVAGKWRRWQVSLMQVAGSGAPSCLPGLAWCSQSGPFRPLFSVHPVVSVCPQGASVDGSGALLPASPVPCLSLRPALSQGPRMGRQLDLILNLKRVMCDVGRSRKTAVSCPERMALLRWRLSQEAWWRVIEAHSDPLNPGNRNRCARGPSGVTETLPLSVSGSWWAGYPGAWCSQSSGFSDHQVPSS